MHLDNKIIYHMELSPLEYRLINRALRGAAPEDEAESDARVELSNAMFEQRRARFKSLAESFAKSTTAAEGEAQ